jgi:lipopolysaccharide export system permease protein
MRQNSEITGQQVQLELLEGDIHRKTSTHTKINFGKLSFALNENYQIREKDKTLQSMSLDELRKSRIEAKAEPKILRSYEVEYHRRIAISFACLIFALLGSALGINNHRRSGRGSGLVVALTVIVSYWVLFVAFESTARTATQPAVYFIWIPNLIFMIATARTLRKQAT